LHPEKKGEATMELASQLKSNLVTKAVKNVRRGTRKEEIEGTMFRPEVTLDLQRSRLFTESFMQTDGEAMVLRRAKALAHLLRNMRVFIRDWERIVGYQTEDPNGLYHPIDMNWRSVKRLVRTEAGETLLDKAGRQELDEICAYWKGKSMSDRVQDLFTGDLGKYWKYEGTFLWLHGSELGIPDYEELFRTGLKGRIQMARDRLEEIDRSIPSDYVDQKEFLQSVIIALEAVIDFAGRYAAHARKMAASESDPERKHRLEEIARVCEHVPAEPPRTFLEAIQFFFFVHLVRSIEYPTAGIGVRFDKVFGPYYEGDLRNGKITRDEAIELIQLLWAKFLELGLVYSPMVSSVYGGVASLQALTLGGTDAHGNDVTNGLTYVILEAARMMRTIEPSIALRIHNGTPDELLSAAVDVIKTGIGYPSLFNDEALIPLLEQWKAKPEEARDYAVTGCVYMELPGKNITRRAVGYFVLPKCLWRALHRGVNPETGEQWGPRTADPADFTCWEDLLEAYLEQVRFFGNMMISIENTCRDLYAKYCPRPFYSAVVEGCIEQGKECKQWVHDSSVSELFGPIGATNVADALAAVKKVVFEDKSVTLPELIEIMDRNWEGREDIRQACINAPKFGNDDDGVDHIAREVHYRTEEVVHTFKDRFGHHLTSDGSAVSSTYGLAADTPATPDGRVDGAPFADSSLAPQPGMDKKGPTAVLNSCAKIEASKTYNHLLNQKFQPQFVEGDMKPVFINYLKTWRDKRIPHIQFNIVDKETLVNAQQNPEEHRDLIVRVAGFSAYFTDLSRGLQDHIIARTEQRL
jgi:pyruvate formate-lyase/glycerol dehydratase family glycyl radical enzyme